MGKKIRWNNRKNYFAIMLQTMYLFLPLLQLMTIIVCMNIHVKNRFNEGSHGNMSFMVEALSSTRSTSVKRGSSSSSSSKMDKHKYRYRNMTVNHYHPFDQKFSKQLKALVYSKQSFPLSRKGRMQRANDVLLNTLHEYMNILTSNSMACDISAVVRPNRYHFGIIMDGWTKQSQFDNADVKKLWYAARKVEELLLRMIELADTDTFTNDDRDNMSFYQNYTNFRMMIKPDRVNFTTVIYAWAEVGEALKAEGWLRKMIEMCNDDKINLALMPDSRTYTCVIRAWVNRAQQKHSNKNKNGMYALQRAESVLNEMQELYNSGKNLSCKPDTYAFNTLLHGYAQSDNAMAPYKAESLLLQMKSLNLANLISYSCVIDAWVSNKTFYRVQI